MFGLYVYENSGNPNRAREVGHRITLALFSIVVSLTAVCEPTSARAIIANAAGPWGVGLHYLLIAFACGALLDVVANDFLKRGGLFTLLMDGRVNFYMMQAIVNMAIVGVMLKYESWVWPAAVNGVIALASMWVAVVDTVWRYVQPRNEGRKHDFGLPTFEGVALRHVAPGRTGLNNRDVGRDV
jgi:hypothetical protein